MRQILDISDADLYHIAKEELNLIDREITKITRDKYFVVMQWASHCGSGLIRVLKNSITLEREARDYYLTQKSIDYLVGRGYEIPKDFVYDDRDIWVGCDCGEGL